MRQLLSLALAGLLAAPLAAKDKDVFDYDGQKSAPDEMTKVVFIGDAGTHGPPGNHEFMAGSMYIARQLNAAYDDVHAVVYSSKNWPKDLSHADAIIVSLNHGGKAAKDANILAATRKGAGFMAIHYGVEVNKGEEGDNYLNWMGGYFEKDWSVNPWWVAKFDKFPDHPTSRGVKPFSIRDEWYYHMRFPESMKGVTPVLSALPPLNTIKKQQSPRAGNPTVYKKVSDGQPQVLSWAYERPDGGRGFGFTGLHLHSNLANPGFRQVLANGAAWVSGKKIPEAGVPTKQLDKDELNALITESRQAIKDGK